MKQNLLKRFLATLMLFAFCTISWAYDFKVGRIYFNINSDKTSVTVVYKEISGNSYSGSINIPSQVIYNSKTYNVTSIGGFAFEKCSGLTSVTIPNSVTSIGYGAFKSCSSLTSVTIPNSVTSIGSSAFSGCSRLTSVTIPNSVTSIGDFAFMNCSGLTSVTIPESVTRIGTQVFYGCSGLTSVTIPNSVTSIGSLAFYKCSTLTSITIPNSVTSIVSEAFSDCSGLTSVTIGNSVTSIGEFAFYNCSGLTSIKVEDGNPKYDSRNNCNAIITSSTNTLIAGCRTTTIPNSVTSIGQNAFSGCSSLTSVTIPNSVTSIGKSAFSGCSSLTSVTIPNSVTSIGKSAFSGCSSLTSVYCQAKIIPSAAYAFQNSSVASATLYVPGPAVNSYKSTAPWSSFGKIEPFYYDFESDNICYKINDDSITVSITSCDTDPYDTYSGSVVIPSTIKYQNKVYNVTSIGNDAFPATTKIYVDNGVLPLIAVWKYGISPYDLSTNTCLTNPFDTRICSNASSIGLLGSVPENLIKIENESLTIDGVTKSGQNASITGLTPNTSYQVQYNATITYGDGSSTYTKDDIISTEALSLTTSQPKVISVGNAVVGAISNIDDAEENVGFEWRRTDWTDDFASNTGVAFLYEGTMEGYIRNLYTEKLWKVRPYYKDNTGQYYYGDWVGLDPTNTSYYEPTVHTYARIDQTENKVQVSGYVQRGTDAVSKQGFKYWVQEDNGNARGAGISIPSGAKTVEAEGRVMEVELTGLKPNTTYAYVAFVTTTEGETFYGKQLSFTTGDDPEASVTGDANGNGVVEIGDVTSVLTLMATPEATGYNNKAADANGNGVIEIGDVTTILTIMAGN